MAGMGPAPKEQKLRRNKEPGMDELPAEGYSGKYPPLPATYGVEVVEKDAEGVAFTRQSQVSFLHVTREWYETWATSPMATLFTGVDWNRLQRIAIIADSFYRHPSKDLAAELRLQEAGFGGSPLDRLRARMRIAEAASGEQAPRTRSAGSSSRRDRLSIVK